MPEVELFSLLEEKIPMYKLRADTTSTLTYEHSDWLRSSSSVGLEEDPCELLSPVMMEETLKYFTLCGDRVVQMTKTYNDIDAVTRLLEEKEKDLELAAKIGQSLLEQNKQLEKRIDTLEEQFTLASDQNTQLKHDMKLKEQLLRIYTHEVSYSDSEDEAAQCDRSHTVQSKFINVEALQKKVRVLEEENFQLRMETAEMKTKTVSIEEKEAQLVQDAFKQLGEAQGREGVMTEELSRRLEETYQQKEEITCLLAQIVDLQQKVKRLSIENEELQHQYQAARDAQQSLTKELQESRDKSDEYVTLLNEARSEAKEIHRRSLPKSNLPSYSMGPLPVFPPDSLAAELVDSMEQEMSGGIPKLGRHGNKREQNKNIMRTVKDLNRAATGSRAPSEYSSELFNPSQHTSPGSSVISMAGSNRCDTPLSYQYEGDNESNNSPSGSVHQIGKTGIPGSNDLETALRRLNLRKQNEDAEQKYAEEEKLRVLHGHDIASEGSYTPTCPTPGSIWSTESFAGLPALGCHGSYRSFMPEKLQIVKPMEGSLTLYHWQRLAQPHMASMLDVRPGVMVKGFRELERDPAVYSMDDVEDDGRVVERTCVPSKCFVSTCSTYTYTTSTIGLLDNTLLTSSNQGPRMANTEHVSKTERPVAAKTFSTSLGLAHVLKERDVDDSNEAKVLTKVEAAAINPAGVNAGLNMFGASSQPLLKSASEAKREADMRVVEEPPGMHRISSRIFSRFAVPVRSKNITDALDPETKTRLMEKVKKIRAEKETSERRARTLQRQPSIPSIRTKDVVMSPVRTPKPSSSSTGLSVEGSCMGLEGAVGGYSPPGIFGSHSGTVHRNSSLSSDTKLARKLFASDDSGVELGFGTPSPGPTTVVSNNPFQMSFRGTVSTTRSVPGFNTVLDTSKPSGPLIKGNSSHSVMHSNPYGSQEVGLLGALSSTETVYSNPKQQVPCSMSYSTTVSSKPMQQVPHSMSYTPIVSSCPKQEASLSGTHVPGVSSYSNPPLGKATSLTSSTSSQLSGQHGPALLMSSSSSTSTRPRSSVIMPATSMKSSEPTQSQAAGIGLASLLGASRPSMLLVGENKGDGGDVPEGPGVSQATTQGVTSPMSVFVGNLPTLKGFRKPGPML